MELPEKPTKDDLEKIPQQLVTSDGDGNTSPYVVTCTNLNTNALRYYTSRELELASNESEQNRLYKKFEICPEYKSVSGTFVNLNNTVTDKGSAYRAGYCPQGYRIPNQLELAMIRFYCDKPDNNYPLTNGAFTRTFWSMGKLGTKKQGDKTGFLADNLNLYLSTDHTASQARCVRDIRVD